MKRIGRIADWYALVVFLGTVTMIYVTSCSPRIRAPMEGTTPGAIKGATRSILTDTPCAPPCWYGIVPGIPMEGEEIVQMLMQAPNVGTIWESAPGVIDWTWDQWPWEGTGYNNIFLREGTVYNVSLSVDFELTVEQILTKYGLPEATYAARGGLPDYPNYVAFFLCYPTQGVYFTAQLHLFRPTIEPTSRVYEALFTAPYESLESWESSLGYDTLRALSLQPWPGYGQLDEQAYNLRLP